MAYLGDEKEKGFVKYLDKKNLNDFWSAFTYLRKSVQLTEDQAFSICVRKFGYEGMTDPDKYDAIIVYNKKKPSSPFPDVISYVLRNETVYPHFRPLYDLCRRHNHLPFDLVCEKENDAINVDIEIHQIKMLVSIAFKERDRLKGFESES